MPRIYVYKLNSNICWKKEVCSILTQTTHKSYSVLKFGDPHFPLATVVAQFFLTCVSKVYKDTV